MYMFRYKTISNFYFIPIFILYVIFKEGFYFVEVGLWKISLYIDFDDISRWTFV